MAHRSMTRRSPFVDRLLRLFATKRHRISKDTEEHTHQPHPTDPPRPPSPQDAQPQQSQMAPQPPFPLMALPPELREIIYLHALAPITPIDTAAIPNAPDIVRIPPIAQLSQQTRNEALHVLFRSRPIEISLHSDENVRRALLWADKWRDHACALPRLIFSGRVTRRQFEFFTITLEIQDEAPYFRASAKKAASAKTDRFVAEMKRDMLDWLEGQLEGVREKRAGHLSAAALVELIVIVAETAKCTTQDYQMSALWQAGQMARRRLRGELPKFEESQSHPSGKSVGFE